MKIPKEVSEQILTIGESYINHRGGIAGVINSYSTRFETFKFIASYKPFTNKLVGIPYFLKAVYKLLIILFFDKKIKVVHLHSAAKGSFFRKLIIFVICKYFFKKSIVFHCHGSEFKDFFTKNKVFSFLVRFLVNRVDLVICLSNSWKKFFSEKFSPRQVIVLENIIERPVTLLKNSSKSVNGTLKLLFLGSIGDRKGIFDVLEVFKINKDVFHGKLELIIGGNGDIGRLQNYIINNDLQELVKYHGWVSGTKKAELLAESNLYILPSYNEGLPLSILEAMSYNLPIISTPVGGIPEIVFEGVNGFLIPPGDLSLLTKTLNLFLDNRNCITDMGDQSSKVVIPYYEEGVIPKLTTLYTFLLMKIAERYPEKVSTISL
ncbi:glycosyltransferase family 4 protein [Aridibaculum aurantiacum]|uniref:glycosyltransferase family 4 protein n=1 Tax=Aridibaculum aurantiacum TaxID=2810307 RepID=UPI001A97416A|nr:glycosyltransferase family 4 protein [Aridibaculum aurantiacum]